MVSVSYAIASELEHLPNVLTLYWVSKVENVENFKTKVYSFQNINTTQPNIIDNNKCANNICEVLTYSNN